LGEVCGMQAADVFDLFLEAVASACREGDGAVFVSLAFADDELMAMEVDVFEAKSAAFQGSHAGAVEEFNHEADLIAG
jgi:hypothetical protein